jgi:hypothetical protein
MRRTVLILLAVVAALAVTPAASADKPTREVFGPVPDFTTDLCAFPVLVHTIGDTIVITFTDDDGNVTRQNLFFPGNKQVLTNLATGKTLTFPTNGPGFFEFNPDGSGSLTATGPALGFQVGDEPGLFWTAGRYVETFDADGNTTSIEFKGHVEDVCAQLAA